MFDFDKKKKKIFTYKSFFTVALPCFISVTIAAAVVVIYLFCVANALVSFSFFLIIFLFDINILKKKQGKENFLLVFIRYIFFLPFFPILYMSIIIIIMDVRIIAASIYNWNCLCVRNNSPIRFQNDMMMMIQLQISYTHLHLTNIELISILQLSFWLFISKRKSFSFPIFFFTHLS